MMPETRAAIKRLRIAWYKYRLAHHYSRAWRHELRLEKLRSKEEL